MQNHITTLFLTVISAVAGLSAEKPSSEQATSRIIAPVEPAAGREAVLLHEWPGVVPLGFNARGQFLVFNGNRRVFEAHDLGATNAAVTDWNAPKGLGRVFGGSLSADRRKLATLMEAGKERSQIQLWNAETGERIGPVFAPSDVAHVAFSPDGKLLAGVVALDGTVRVWDAASGELRWSMSLPQPVEVTWIGLEFSPDGRFLAARNSFAIQIWNMTERRVAGTGDLNFYHAISPDWKLAHGFTVKAKTQKLPRATLLDITDPDRPTPAKALPQDAVGDEWMCAFAAGGRLLTQSSDGKRLQLWDTANRRVLAEATIEAGKAVPIRVALSPDARVLARIEFEPGKGNPFLHGELRLWDVATGKPLIPSRPVPGMFWNWQFDPGSRHLVVAFVQANGAFTTQLWRLPPGEPPWGRGQPLKQ